MKKKPDEEPAPEEDPPVRELFPKPLLDAFSRRSSKSSAVTFSLRRVMLSLIEVIKGSD